MIPLKDFYLPLPEMVPLISKLHSILAVSNLLAHNNITKSYHVQLNSLRLISSVASKWTSKHLGGGGTFILLLMVHTHLCFNKFAPLNLHSLT